MMSLLLQLISAVCIGIRLLKKLEGKSSILFSLHRYFDKADKFCVHLFCQCLHFRNINALVVWLRIPV